MRTFSSLLSFRTWASGRFQACALHSPYGLRVFGSAAKANPRNDKPFSSEERNYTTTCFPCLSSLFFNPVLLFQTFDFRPIWFCYWLLLSAIQSLDSTMFFSKSLTSLYFTPRDLVFGYQKLLWFWVAFGTWVAESHRLDSKLAFILAFESSWHLALPRGEESATWK